MSLLEGWLWRLPTETCGPSELGLKLTDRWRFPGVEEQEFWLRVSGSFSSYGWYPRIRSMHVTEGVRSTWKSGQEEGPACPGLKWHTQLELHLFSLA